MNYFSILRTARPIFRTFLGASENESVHSFTSKARLVHLFKQIRPSLLMRGRFEFDQPYKQKESKMQVTVTIWNNKQD